jgi:hypothetical protein
LRLGYGYFIGALLLTLWMRAEPRGIRFGWIAIGVPLLVGTGMFLGVAARRGRLETAGVRATLVALMRPPTLRGLHTWVWWLLIAWLVLRFALLAAEVAWQPLYPWDAWVQWATKARVWYELGRIVPFVGADAWLSDTSGAYFDASPSYPATIPLLQVWSCIALGRWDDSAMNWPWLLMLIALTLGVYGALRDSGLPPLGALVGGFLVASLPLVDVHVALAGYADLMAAAMYALAALALHRWTLHRDPRDAGIAIALALACPMIQPIGIVWALTLLPGVIVALLPRRGMRLVAAGFGVAALAISRSANPRPRSLAIDCTWSSSGPGSRSSTVTCCSRTGTCCGIAPSRWHCSERQGSSGRRWPRWGWSWPPALALSSSSPLTPTPSRVR